MEIIKVENLKYWYPDSDQPALRDINLTVNEGEFILIAGPSGCGKSTLLRAFNRTVPDFYGGKTQGSVFLNNKNIRQYDRREISKSAGMVYQHPEKQTVMEGVEREIAFGLENLNFEMNRMKRNVAEVISFLNLGSIRENTTSRISGGELQKTAIASVIAMDPDILLFDEPISQLDPIASEEVLNFIKRLNRDMGKTVILVEQRLDRCFELADRILFMEEGRIVTEGKPYDLPREINKKYFLPAITHIFRQAGFENPPITVKDAKKSISNMDIHEPEYKAQAPGADVLQVRRLSFQYERGRDVLKNINLSLKKGKITAVMGENGAGKSTLFKIAAGLLEGYSGQVLLDDREISQYDSTGLIKRIGYLSQNPNDYLGRPTVFEEVAYTLKNIGEFNGERVEVILEKLGIYRLRDKNPRDLSGGEKQRVAIACTIITNPDILILDEPTRGLDAQNKGILGELLRGLADEGKSIVLITHDSDFAGDFTDDVILMFNGEIVAGGNTREILHDSIYYSPQVSRAFKNKCKIVSSKDALGVLRCSK